MRYHLRYLICDSYKTVLFRGSRRYLTRWQDLNYIRAQKDGYKSNMFPALTSKMKEAINKVGSADPSKNSLLSQLIERAKKINMPSSSINGVLEQMKNVKSLKHQVVLIRGDTGFELFLHLSSPNVVFIKNEIKHLMKKYPVQFIDADEVMRTYEHATYVVACKDCSLDEATEDALKVDAHDVQEIQDGNEKYFQFKFEPNSSLAKEMLLTNMGYTVLVAEDSVTPESSVQLNEKDFQVYKLTKEKLLAKISDVVKIEDNVLEK